MRFLDIAVRELTVDGRGQGPETKLCAKLAKKTAVFTIFANNFEKLGKGQK